MHTGRLKMKQSGCFNPLCIVLLFALSHSILPVRGSGNYASTKSKYNGQLATSSTLRWRHIMGGHGKNRIPVGAVPSGTGNPSKVICRAEHHGTLLVGQTTIPDERCAVGFINKIHKKRKFEVLINTDRAARLEWRSYNKFAGVPVGAVAAVDENSEPASGDYNVFIGRHLGESGIWRPGAVEVPRRSSYSSFGKMRVFDQSDSSKELVQPTEHSSGDILVEVEPVRYELDIHDISNDKMFKNRPKETKKHEMLVNGSLFRFDDGRDEKARLQKVFSYELKKSEYYGQVSGMIKALPTTIRLSNGETQSVPWGLPETSKQRETMMVGHDLKHQTAVDVFIVADKITLESPYRATLTSIFPDGTRRQRKNVEGVLQRKYLNNIRAEYSQVREIKQIKVKENNHHKNNKRFENNEKRSSNGKSSHNHHNNNYVTQYEWNDESVNHNGYQKTKRQPMLSDQMTQKSSTGIEEKEKQLPSVFKPSSNSSQNLLYLSNFTILSVSFFLTFYATVLSVRFNTNTITLQSFSTR